MLLKQSTGEHSQVSRSSLWEKSCQKTHAFQEIAPGSQGWRVHAMHAYLLWVWSLLHVMAPLIQECWENVSVFSLGHLDWIVHLFGLQYWAALWWVLLAIRIYLTLSVLLISFISSISSPQSFICDRCYKCDLNQHQLHIGVQLHLHRSAVQEAPITTETMLCKSSISVDHSAVCLLVLCWCCKRIFGVQPREGHIS